ncbi:two-component system sensor histidine kinase DegS [Anaerosolibacter carboniphilus]|uniref:Oxygen sensor histidine kinase NreB n=1 Tax=Anaerosolibacter carboniphilus TaxID=1417629 RepID=A0A841KXI1_9FIRM|nr:sensor histidine kinase [Anaerosolibacter carboniphilus]MBB6215642.1 two-component system sensor histidine kinase DegS [Anaerosolibacter carboniphilus]
MNNRFQMDIKKINEIVKSTIDAIERGKNEIFEIAERARSECKNIELLVEEIKRKTVLVIQEVDQLELKEKDSRKKLVSVSKNFSLYSEPDIKAAYENAKDLQIKITLKRQEEKELIRQRTDLEKRLKNSYEVVKKAENLVSQVGVVMGYLSGNLLDVVGHLEDIQQRQIMGIKVLKAQEEERQRIARDIHDGPAQLMANLVIKAEICEKLIDRDVDKAKFELSQLKSIGRECLKDVRKIIYDLRPMSLDDLGLVPTIQRFILNFEEETHINVSFSVIAKKEVINSTVQLSLFRIIQEALNNVRKHAQASAVVIKLEIINKTIHILILDDGVGFNVETKMKSCKEESGFGLLAMRERVELLKGCIEIDSNLGTGTRIKISIPVGDEEESYE